MQLPFCFLFYPSNHRKGLDRQLHINIITFYMLALKECKTWVVFVSVFSFFHYLLKVLEISWFGEVLTVIDEDGDALKILFVMLHKWLFISDYLVSFYG